MITGRCVGDVSIVLVSFLLSCKVLGCWLVCGLLGARRRLCDGVGMYLVLLGVGSS